MLQAMPHSPSNSGRMRLDSNIQLWIEVVDGILDSKMKGYIQCGALT